MPFEHVIDISITVFMPLPPRVPEALCFQVVRPSVRNYCCERDNLRTNRGVIVKLGACMTM